MATSEQHKNMKKILIVDDDANIRNALSIRLKAAGYGVMTSSSGFRGLVSVLKEKPDLIISDIWMPHGVGFALAKRLEELNLNGIPIIFISAGTEPGLRQQAEDFGAAAFFEKPFHAEELMNAVADAVATGDAGNLSIIPSDPSTPSLK